MGQHPRGDGGFAASLAAARDGDAAAWSALYHRIAPLLIGYLRAQRLPDPEDVAGEVLLEVVRDLYRFDGDERGFRSWVLAIAHHRLLDARRRDGRRPLRLIAPTDLDLGPAQDDPAAESLAHVGLGELGPALATLTDEQRTVLLLRVLADLSVTEVARVVGKREGAVKQLQRRAAEAMRRALADPTRPPTEHGDRTAVRALPATRPSGDRHAVGGAHRDTGTAG